jgi:hypothetical protein
VLRRLPGKAPKRWNIEIFLRFGNAARQDASAHKNVKLFLREPLDSLCSTDDRNACPIRLSRSSGRKKLPPKP